MCCELQKKIAMHCYEKEVNHPLLGCVRIQDCQTALKENVKKHLSNKEFPMNGKELNIVRHHFPELLMRTNGNKEHALKFNNVTKIIPKNGINKSISRLLPRKEAASCGAMCDSEHVESSNAIN